MEVRIIRSERRRRTIQAREIEGVLEILAPAAMTDQELAPHIERLRQRIDNRKQKAALDDDLLETRARELNRKYFDGRLKWAKLRWVSNQDKRYGSCSPTQGTIRISHRIAAMPRFVLDYVIVHELAHLLEANHGPRFWRLVNRYPRTERARGYLMAAGLEEIED